MHFLLTNDDGIHAPGLAALEQAVRLIPGARCTVVAPAWERSMCGHALTTHTPLVVHQHGPEHHAVEGTPADCVRIALFALGVKPDYVLSGVNAGGNLGQDLPVSGTMAGAREAAYHGLPAAALSHYLVAGLEVDWHRTARWTAELVQELMARPLEDGGYWSVNFPHLPPGNEPMPERVDTRVCRSPLPVAFRLESEKQGRQTFLYAARYADRARDVGSDVEACFGGNISIVKLRV